MASTMSSSSTKNLERLVQLKQLQIDSLLEVTKSINANHPASALFRIYEFIMRAQMGVKKLLVFHKNTDWKSVCQYGISTDIIEQIDISKDLLHYETITHLPLQPIPFPCTDFDVLIPVYHKQEPLAFILIGDLSSKANHNVSLEEKVKFIQTISNIIIVAIENKRLFKQQLEQESLKKELEVAEQVQTMLIPKTLPNNERIEMAGIYMPHHSISGDYYDYIPLDETGNEFLICMADVSGKGIAAALLMANFQAVLRALAKETTDLKKLIEKLNARLMEITHGEKFITFFIAKHNLTTRKLTYINAGHNSPILSAQNQLTLLHTGCTILGAFEKLPFIDLGELSLPPNSFIITYTDGLTDLESEQGEYFEIERLQTLVKQNTHLPIDKFNKLLLEAGKAFKGNQAYTDDISILSYRIF